MNRLGQKSKDFGELFEEQVEKATKIEARLVFSGSLQSSQSEDAGLDFDLLVSEDPDDQVFVIERKLCDERRVDHHAFIVHHDELGEATIDWWHYKPTFHGKPLFITKLNSEKAANELTRILSQHWDFSKHL